MDVERKYGSLIKGMLAARRMLENANNGSRSRLPMFMTLRGGMQQLTDALIDQLDKDAVHTGVGVTSVTSLNAGGPPYEVRTHDGQTLRADAVLLATPAGVSSELVADLDVDLARDLARVRYVSTAVVSLGYRHQEGAPPLNGFGFIIPKTEERRITACTWSSTKFDHRAPEDHRLVRCFVGGPGREDMVDLDDEDLERVVRDEVTDIMGLRGKPDLVRIFRWRKVNPQYDLGHLDRVEEMRTRAAGHGGLYLAGSSYDGVGVPDCVRQAEDAADSLLAGLQPASALDD
jgi:oxygen-dependent protoporphyrinogen oxidase